MLNNANASGLAEMNIDTGKGQAGLVIVIAFGPDIGNAILLAGRLVPTTELGHIKIRGEGGRRMEW